MEIKNCRHCGKVYLYNGSSLCRDCSEVLEKDFLRVREYVSRHPEADIETITHDTGVGSKLILQMLRDGRLQYKGSNGLRCKTCDASITIGYLCLKCQQDMDHHMRRSSITGKSSGVEISSNIKKTSVLENKKSFHINHKRG